MNSSLISDQDLAAVLDARGGAAYPTSVVTGLVNRCVLATPEDCWRALRRALARGVLVQTPLGLCRRPQQDGGQ
jgi:hypothetical protein